MRRRGKYNAQPTVIDNVRFASKREAARYAELKLLQQAGEIHDLELQPQFPLYAPTRGTTRAELVGVYIADFRYREGPRGVLRVEDVKSKPTRTAIYRWKKKHTEIQYGIDIREV